MPRKKSAPATNVQIVKAIMEGGSYGALTQAFVVQAIRAYAEEIATAPAPAAPADGSVPFIAADAWRSVAAEIRGALDKYYDTAAAPPTPAT